MAGTIRLDLAPSRRLAVVLAAVHALGVLALAASLPWLPLVAGVAIVGVSLGWSLRRVAAGMRQLAIDRDGTVRWTWPSGDTGSGAILATACVQPWLTSFCLGNPGEPRHWLVLMGDEAPPDDLRRLRVWLRWAPDPVPPVLPPGD